jgi:hypothetical protein
VYYFSRNALAPSAEVLESLSEVDELLAGGGVLVVGLLLGGGVGMVLSGGMLTDALLEADALLLADALTPPTSTGV